MSKACAMPENDAFLDKKRLSAPKTYRCFWMHRRYQTEPGYIPQPCCTGKRDNEEEAGGERQQTQEVFLGVVESDRVYVLHRPRQPPPVPATEPPGRSAERSIHPPERQQQLARGYGQAEQALPGPERRRVRVG